MVHFVPAALNLTWKTFPDRLVFESTNDKLSFMVSGPTWTSFVFRLSPLIKGTQTKTRLINALSFRIENCYVGKYSSN